VEPVRVLVEPNGFVSWLQDVGAAFGLASPNEDDVVKRIVAVGGQTVECCDEKNRVVVEGEPLDEPYIHWLPGADTQDDFPPITVPEGKLWVLGDNRNNSCDSRCQGGGGERGLVPVDNVIGKVRYIVLPPSRWRGVGDHNPQVSQAAAMASSTAAQLTVPGVAILAAFPTVWLGRRVREVIRPGGARK
jgi:signal peptidase I